MFWSHYFGSENLKEGSLLKIGATDFILKDNILRQKSIYSDLQRQTKNTFSFKWDKRYTYESEKVQISSKAWLLEKYLDGKTDILNKWLPEGSKMLDAGCGAGFSALLLFEPFINRIHYLGVDISESVDVARKRFEERKLKGEFLQADIMNLPFSEPIINFIFSEGALHHADSTEKALKSLAKLLLHGGRFMFYVYRKKAPIREYVDDYIRNYLRDFDDHEAWDKLMALTKLGKVLGELNVEVNIPEDIPYLGIKAGSIDIQRLFYWYICKAFYKPEFSLDEMNHINFDWYRPLNCHRHTPEEIKRWCNESGLVIERMHLEEAGISVIAIKE